MFGIGLKRVGTTAQGDPYVTLFRDRFAGAAAAVAGRVAPTGQTWAVDSSSPAAAAGVIAGGGAMRQTSEAAAAAYPRIGIGERPGELGCRLSFAAPGVVVTFAGTAAPGDYAVVNITPSRAASAIQIVVYMGSGGTASDAAANLVSWVNISNPDLVAAGITATRSGAAVTISGPECPRVDAVGGGGGLSATAAITPHAIMASWPSAQPVATDGMLHFQVLPTGVLAWDYYLAGVGVTAIPGATSRVVGMQAGVEYAVRACIDPPHVWGGVWAPDGELRSAFLASGDQVETLSGGNIFYEFVAAGNLSYRDSWVYRRPSIPRAVIEVALA